MTTANKSLYAVVLAGGSGTRFWPLSRASLPKQFLDLDGKGTLFDQTLNRILPIVPPENILVVTNVRYKALTTKALKTKNIPLKNLLLEPTGKNTAAAIAWASCVVNRRDPNACVVVLPSDHLIGQPKKFIALLKEAQVLAHKNYLVTLGIRPTRPETGYGYLKIKKSNVVTKNGRIVERFVEKPDMAKAKKFLATKNYLWNSGMFIWRADVIWEQFKNCLPDMHRAFNHKLDNNSIKQFWSHLESISIDYGILEKASHVAAVVADGLDWSDVGSFESVYDLSSKDSQQNVSNGNTYFVDSHANFVRSNKKFIATIGLDNIIIVDTPDALLVCAKNQSQKIRQVVEMLISQKKKLY